MNSKNGIFICISTAALVVLGLVMLASTSVWIEEDATKYTLLQKQLKWTVIGLAVAFFLARIDYDRLRKHSILIYSTGVILLTMCYIPELSRAINGESRWIVLPLVGQFQPSEMAKIAMSIGLVAYLSRYRAEKKKFLRGFLVPGIIMSVPVLLILFETDMGTAAGLGAAGIAVLYLAGARLRYLIPAIVSVCFAMVLLVQSNGNRMQRIMAYQDLEAHKLSYGLQQYRSLLAFSNGGVEGLGLGNGAEKHGYLPFAHTDFIFAIIGEELGLYFSLATVFAFLIFALYGIGIGMQARDRFGRLLAVSLTCSIVIPAMMNIGVATAVLPNTGLPLPFVSYGGTNLVFTLAAVGILISIHRGTPRTQRTSSESIPQPTSLRI